MMSKINKKVFSATVFAVITTVLIVSLFLALPASTQPSIKQAVPESQFNIDIAYAYVGPVPTDKESYFSTKYNQTMIHDSKYPSAVFLNFTRVPGIQIGSCDAVIQVYGIKVTTDTGIAEYHAWSAGTGYATIADEDFSTLTTSASKLIDRNLYRSSGGTFSFNWTENKSILSKTIGSVGSYTGNHSYATDLSTFDLSSKGIPNEVTVAVYRLGYVTMSKGEVTLYQDAIAEKPVAQVELSKYDTGFLYNRIVPSEQLGQIDLFHPKNSG